MAHFVYRVSIDNQEEAKLMDRCQKLKIEETIASNLREVADTYIKDLFKNDIDYIVGILGFEDEEQFYSNVRMESATEVQEILGDIFYDNFCTSSPVDDVGRSNDWKKFDSSLLSTITENYSSYFKDNTLKLINDIVNNIENPTVENLYDKLSEIINGYYEKYKAF